jgi:hypothetical protein
MSIYDVQRACPLGPLFELMWNSLKRKALGTFPMVVVFTPNSLRKQNISSSNDEGLPVKPGSFSIVERDISLSTLIILVI